MREILDKKFKNLFKADSGFDGYLKLPAKFIEKFENSGMEGIDSTVKLADGRTVFQNYSD